MLSELQKQTFSRIINGANFPDSQALAGAILRGVGEDKPELMRIITANRLAWLDYESINQRRWQRNTRRLHRANHHDSVATREKYVRCVNDWYEIPAVYKGVYGGVCRKDGCPYSAVKDGMCRIHNR